MSFLLDLFGQGDRKIYLRDYRNAYRFRPDVNPVRQPFQGYVNFVFNRDEKLFGKLFNNGDAESTEFRTTISSLVKTADLPSVAFATETYNAYNRKKIVNRDISYDPVNITVHDTVGNEWLTVLMKYFSYHYMDPRNKQIEDSRDIGARIIDKDEMVNSQFGFGDPYAKWDSNLAGYNPNYTAKFFERIDYVLYHGQKAVQYSIINPVMTSFKPSAIDYADSGGLRDFQMTFEYERFTIYNNVNFTLSDEDRDRFEGSDSIQTFIDNYATPNIFQPAVVRAGTDEDGNPINEEIGLGETTLKERKLQILGDYLDPRARTGQAQPTPVLPSEPDGGGPAYLPDTYGDSVAVEVKNNNSGGDFFSDLLLGVADAALSTAINGGNIKDAALGAALGSVTTVIGREINDAINNQQGGN